MESILTSIKKLIGLTEEDTSFDVDIIMHINSVFADLMQLGVGPEKGFSIKDKSSVWNDYISEDDKKLESVKTYVHLRVKLLFDPSSLTSSVIASYERQIEKLEWRLNAAAESAVI